MVTDWGSVCLSDSQGKGGTVPSIFGWSGWRGQGAVLPTAGKQAKNSGGSRAAVRPQEGPGGLWWELEGLQRWVSETREQ